MCLDAGSGGTSECRNTFWCGAQTGRFCCSGRFGRFCCSSGDPEPTGPLGECVLSGETFGLWVPFAPRGAGSCRESQNASVRPSHITTISSKKRFIQSGKLSRHGSWMEVRQTLIKVGVQTSDSLFDLRYFLSHPSINALSSVCWPPSWDSLDGCVSPVPSLFHLVCCPVWKLLQMNVVIFCIWSKLRVSGWMLEGCFCWPSPPVWGGLFQLRLYFH